MVDIQTRFKQANAISKAIIKLRHALELEPKGGINESELVYAMQNCENAMLTITSEIAKMLNSK